MTQMKNNLKLFKMKNDSQWQMTQSDIDSKRQMTHIDKFLKIENYKWLKMTKASKWPMTQN